MTVALSSAGRTRPAAVTTELPSPKPKGTTIPRAVVTESGIYVTGQCSTPVIVF